jgi:hypothetical protein
MASPAPLPSSPPSPATLARRQHRLAWAVAALAVVVVAQGVALVLLARDVPDRRLVLEELAIVDPRGVVRARIGGDLPDAVIDGHRIDRGQRVAGVMLYDDTGQERGGYVTFSPSGNVALTLDTRSGQAALFAADPVAGAALRLWHADDAVELRADPDGSRVSAVRAGAVVLQQPAATLRAEACAAYREALGAMPRGEVEAACAERFDAGACDRCLAPD